MSRQAYAHPLEAFEQHKQRCEECRTSSVGLCAAGFRLLGEAAGMRDDTRQLEFHALKQELGERPLVRMRFGGAIRTSACEHERKT